MSEQEPTLRDKIVDAWKRVTGKKKSDPKEVNLGSGLADNAKKKILSRREQIEEAVEGADSSKPN